MNNYSITNANGIAAVDITVSGNLTVSGTTTALNTTNLDVKDAVIKLNSGQTTALNDIGILMQRYSSPTSTDYNVGFAWEEGTDRLIFGATTEVGGDNDFEFSSEWMTLASNGNIGLGGTTTPASRISIVDSARTGISLTNSDGGNFNIGLLGSLADAHINQRALGPLIISTDGLEKMRITNTGAVGINDALPKAKLDVGGSIVTSTSSYISSNLWLDTVTSTWKYKANGGGSNIRFTDGATGGIAFSVVVGVNNSGGANTSATVSEIMRIANTGNVGIGTNTPQYELDVNAGSPGINSFQASFAGTINNNDWTGIHFGYGLKTTQESRKSAIVFERIDNNARGKIHILNDGVADTGSAVLADSKLTVDFNGNVGVGTTSPTLKFVVSNSGAAGLELDPTAVSSAPVIQAYNRSGAAYIQLTFDALQYVWRPSGTEKMRFTNAGELLINRQTTSGYGKLNVDGGADFTGGNVLLCRDSGNVGVGTASPGYKLEVSGSFAATTKSFVIDHPTKPDMKLRHGSLEGPENGVYVRGRLRAGETIIQLPDYWEGLVDQDTYTVNLTPVGKHQELFVRYIADDYIIVGGDDIDCFYTVYAERKDVEKLEVEIIK